MAQLYERVRLVVRAEIAPRSWRSVDRVNVFMPALTDWSHIVASVLRPCAKKFFLP